MAVVFKTDFAVGSGRDNIAGPVGGLDKVSHVLDCGTTNLFNLGRTLELADIISGQQAQYVVVVGSLFYANNRSDLCAVTPAFWLDLWPRMGPYRAVNPIPNRKKGRSRTEL